MVARPLRLKHSPQRRRVVPEGFAALADVAQAWPWKMISHGRDTLRCQHVEHAQARCHRLFAIGIERELTSWVLDHHRVVVCDVARDGRLAAGRCDCAFYARMSLQRGPCKHLLALHRKITRAA